MDALRFTADYQEDVALADGSHVRIRQIRADDKGRLRQILEGMSMHSRLMRFFSPRFNLSEAELRYLTEVDGVNHLALLALRGEEAVGVARFVRLAGPRSVAEPALAVIDGLHRRGLGAALFSRLVAAARERAVRCFQGEVLPGNRAMLRLLRGAGAAAVPPGETSDGIGFRVDLGAERVLASAA